MEQRTATYALQIRLDERLRYLVNIATVVTGRSITEIVTEAIEEKLKTVSLYKRPSITRLYGVPGGDWPELYDEGEEQANRAAMNLGLQADLLWSESRCTRLEMLDLIAPHLLSAEERRLLDYVRAVDDYKIQEGQAFKLNREKVDRDMPKIEASLVAKSGEKKVVK
jgi:hypothetical protein